MTMEIFLNFQLSLSTTSSKLRTASAITTNLYSFIHRGKSQRVDQDKKAPIRFLTLRLFGIHARRFNCLTRSRSLATFHLNSLHPKHHPRHERLRETEVKDMKRIQKCLFDIFHITKSDLSRKCTDQIAGILESIYVAFFRFRKTTKYCMQSRTSRGEREPRQEHSRKWEINEMRWTGKLKPKEFSVVLKMSSLSVWLTPSHSVKRSLFASSSLSLPSLPKKKQRWRLNV